MVITWCVACCERHGFIFKSYTFPLHLAVQQLLVCQWSVKGCPTFTQLELGTGRPRDAEDLRSMRAHGPTSSCMVSLTVALSPFLPSLFGCFLTSEDGPSRTGPFQVNELISHDMGSLHPESATNPQWSPQIGSEFFASKSCFVVPGYLL